MSATLALSDSGIPLVSQDHAYRMGMRAWKKEKQICFTRKSGRADIVFEELTSDADQIDMAITPDNFNFYSSHLLRTLRVRPQSRLRVVFHDVAMLNTLSLDPGFDRFVANGQASFRVLDSVLPSPEVILVEGQGRQHRMIMEPAYKPQGRFLWLKGLVHSWINAGTGPADATIVVSFNADNAGNEFFAQVSKDTKVTYVPG